MRTNNEVNLKPKNKYERDGKLLENVNLRHFSDDNNLLGKQYFTSVTKAVLRQLVP